MLLGSAARRKKIERKLTGAGSFVDVRKTEAAIDLYIELRESLPQLLDLCVRSKRARVQLAMRARRSAAAGVRSQKKERANKENGGRDVQTRRQMTLNFCVPSEAWQA